MATSGGGAGKEDTILQSVSERQCLKMWRETWTKQEG